MDFSNHLKEPTKKEKVELYHTEPCGTSNKEKQRVQFPLMKDLEDLPFDDLPSFTKLEYGTGTHIRNLVFHCSNGTQSLKTSAYAADKSVEIT